MNHKQQPARVRFAPSPTGYLHLGGARTALYDYLLARQTGGAFVLRIEDTDQKRYVPQAEEEFKNALHWLGLNWDEGPDTGGPFSPYRQSLRKDIHLDFAKELITRDKAYYCFCSQERLDRVREKQTARNENPRYDGTCRQLAAEEAAARVAAGEEHVIRFKTLQEGTVICRDLLRGEIRVDAATLDDMILVKSNGLAVYHLAAMVDDHLMGITHVIRGAEWLPTFPLHKLLYDAFGWEEPIWIHLSLLLKPDGKGKMSKRDAEQAREKGQPIFIDDMESLGYLPEAVNNWLALMGWSYDDKSEFFTMEDLVEKFSLEKLNPSPAAINFTKLDHFNGLHIRGLSVEEFAKRIRPYFERAGYTVDDEKLPAVAAAIQDRTKKLTDVGPMAGFLFEDEVQIAEDRIVNQNLDRETALAAVSKLIKLFEDTPELTQESTEQYLRDMAVNLGLKAGHIFGLLREALTGQKVSPPIFDIMEILGKGEVLARMRKAREVLANMA